MITALEAEELLAAHSAEVRRLSRLTLAQLKHEEAIELSTRGQHRIMGGPVTKEEFRRELLNWSYPTERLNEATHVLHHKPGESWSACEWCHPHQGSTCQCGLGRQS